MNDIGTARNIEYLVMRVSKTHGNDFVKTVLSKYDAVSIDDINPCYFDDIIGDLIQIDEDG